MRECVSPGTAERSGTVRPLRRAVHSYRHIPKLGGSEVTAILARSFPFVSGPGRGCERGCSGTFRNVSGPARSRIHTAVPGRASRITAFASFGFIRSAAVTAWPPDNTDEQPKIPTGNGGPGPNRGRLHRASRVRSAVSHSYGSARSCFTRHETRPFSSSGIIPMCSASFEEELRRNT